MSKKVLPLAIAGLLLASTAANAASTRNSFGGKNGFYIGGNLGASKVNYSNGSSTTSNNSTPVEVIAGARYYVGDIGVGAKGSITKEKYSNTAGDTTSSADGVRSSVEAQVFYDIFNYRTNLSQNTMGVTLGTGYENVDYTNVTSKTTNAGVETSLSYKNYTDSSIFYTAALNFRMGVNRVEVGYKIVNYKEKTVSEAANGSQNPDKVGFRLSDTIFVNYSFSF